MNHPSCMKHFVVTSETEWPDSRLRRADGVPYVWLAATVSDETSFVTR